MFAIPWPVLCYVLCYVCYHLACSLLCWLAPGQFFVMFASTWPVLWVPVHLHVWNWSLQYCSLSLISFKPFSKWLVWLLPCCFARWFCIYDIGQWLWYGFNPVPRIISTKMVCVILIARLDGSAGTAWSGIGIAFNPIYSTKMFCYTNCPYRWLYVYGGVLPLT